MTPKRIQWSRAAGWKPPKGAIRVDEGTQWGNPFVVSKKRTLTRNESVYLFRYMLGGYLCVSKETPPHAQLAYVAMFRAYAGSLRGKDLICRCPLTAPCHGDILLELANSDLQPSDPLEHA